MLSFVSVHDYLHSLKEIALQLAPLKERAIFYLAAAVSDFMIPLDHLPKHKTPSSAEGLNLCLQATPKILRLLTTVWCPHAYVVTFKVNFPWILFYLLPAWKLKFLKMDVVGNIGSSFIAKSQKIFASLFPSTRHRQFITNSSTTSAVCLSQNATSYDLIYFLEVPIIDLIKAKKNRSRA